MRRQQVNEPLVGYPYRFCADPQRQRRYTRPGTSTRVRPESTPTPSPTCTVTLSPSGYSGIGADAGGGGINVSAPAGCSWTAVSNAAWITINKGRLGPGAGETWTGNGEISFSFTANSTVASRTGVLTIGGQTFTFQQNGFSCNQSNASLSPTSASFTAAGGTGSVAVSYTVGCAWDVLPNITDATWVTVDSPGVRIGPSTVTYTVAPNTTGAGRQLFLGWAGKTFRSQEGR